VPGSKEHTSPVYGEGTISVIADAPAKEGSICDSCRSVRATVQKMQADIAALSKTITQMQSDIKELQPPRQAPILNEVAKISEAIGKIQLDIMEMKVSHQEQNHTTTADLPTAVCHNNGFPPLRSTNLPAEEICRVINDINRRKCNVIVSGLAEDSVVSDVDKFQQLCENYLQCKPLVISCHRLGRHNLDKPRRLLVRLLNSSRLLRYVEDELVAQTVFINPDLTPEAAKLAYEERQKRRQRLKL